MRNFLSKDVGVDGDDMGGMRGADIEEDMPIADLFPETTVMFADIAGFTAWCSVREPAQVFTLLEKIYGAFDRIAMRRGVFKVETIGDSYIAVCGLPGKHSNLHDAWRPVLNGSHRLVPQNGSTLTNINRKATIVIEHLIQASDVAHTMQHWHIYTKWNEFLFQKMSLASYVVGRATKDPADFWFKGELAAFFDSYIIPLARKLSECGVFGVSSDEYLNYALHNREECWERKGEEILEKFQPDFQAKLRNEYGHLLRMGTQQTPEIQTAQLGIDGSVHEDQDYSIKVEIRSPWGHTTSKSLLNAAIRSQHEQHIQHF
jgi:Adenylate and Guanylate cyclase catalytic domain